MMSLADDARAEHFAVTFLGDDYQTCFVCDTPAPCTAVLMADALEAADRGRDEANGWAKWALAELNHTRANLGTANRTLDRQGALLSDVAAAFGRSDEWGDLAEVAREVLAQRDEARAKEAEATSMMLGESYDYECARIDLAEARAAIARVEDLAEKYDDQCGVCGSISGGSDIAEDIRRALRGEQG